MEHISKIDPFTLGRSPLSEQERENLRLAKYQQQKEEGYQLLAELCCLGEYDAAKQLANRHSGWGYKIIDGEVMERQD